jgi:hypothetical protein
MQWIQSLSAPAGRFLMIVALGVGAYSLDNRNER